MNGITVIRQDGGLERPAEGTDHISLLLVVGAAAAFEMDIRSAAEALTVAGFTPTAEPLLYYHINEFFRMAPGSRLVVKSVTLTTVAQFDVIKQLQAQKQGVIKQVGIHDGTVAFSTNRYDTLQTICNDLATDNMPIVALVSPRIVSADYATLPDLTSFNKQNIGFVISQDNAGFGRAFTANALVGTIGAALGAVAKSKVNESIAWVEKNNMVKGKYKNPTTNVFHSTSELDTLGFIDDINYNSFTKAQIDALDAKGYIFLRKHISLAGSYFNHSRTAAAATSDYAYIENVRTMNKAARAVYSDLLPKLSSPAYLNAEDGQLTADTVAALEEVASNGVAQMQRDGELSGYSVAIPANQPILQVPKLSVQLRAVPVGVIREFTAYVGFALKLN
jgi:hypothetical protein